MGRLMFFIFMPIIFEFICFLISHFNLDWFDNLKQEIGLFSVHFICFPPVNAVPVHLCSAAFHRKAFFMLQPPKQPLQNTDGYRHP